MSALRMKSGEFIAAASEPESLVEQLLSNQLQNSLSKSGDSEQRSWRYSLPVLAEDLAAAGLTDVDVYLEFPLPLSSQRVDALLAGTHPATGNPSFVLLELKQWSSGSLFEKDPNLILVPGLHAPQLHPARQVNGYRRYFTDFVTGLDGNHGWVEAATYLHNARASAFHDSFFDTEEAAIFTSETRDSFRAFLQQTVGGVRDEEAVQAVLGSPTKPSKKLMQLAAEEVQNREQFVLVGEQQHAVDLVKHEVALASKSRNKRVIIVSGGPGSGKSAIALSVLGDLARDGYSVLHATGSRSFTQTLRKNAGYRDMRTQSLFKYFNSFINADTDVLDVLVADESHRIRKTSNSRYTRAKDRSSRLQIDELVSVARVPVFLLDDNQVVRNGELGSTEDIKNFAKSMGYEVVHIELTEQFRCGGSAKYVDWVEQILGLTDRKPPEATLDPDDPFEVKLASTPYQMEMQLQEHMKSGDTARIVAGFCWPWSNAQNGQLVDDVTIGDWAKPWNNKGERRIGDAPPSALWATREGGFGQVGCIYTAQGFEFDWAGVILGPDLIWRDGRFQSVRSANRDPHFSGRNQVPNELFDLLVRHVYKVLLTRGMKGVILYSPDPETQDALHQLIS